MKVSIKSGKINQFIESNKDALIEALDNHLSEIQSIMESADDEDYIKDNKARQKLLKRLLINIKLT